ncbi:MAG: flagellar basal body P-ring formation protein FlgA [Gammaproteobacteria bacterium]|nr:flagellar basal body P-ring formation protein FlgA [Gammaproteobacteria bacterium]
MIKDHDTAAKTPRRQVMTLIFMLALMAFDLPANEIQSHDSIMEAARRHILDHSSDYPSPPQVSAGRLDSRLRLAACDQPLESYTPQGRRRMGKITVGIRCNGTHPWSMFVPVTVKVMTQVVVARDSLPRGAVIGEGDIGLEQRDISRLHRGYLEKKTAVLGKKLRQRIRQHQVITPSQLDSPHAIKRNNRVTILASSKALKIRVTGKALQNGSLGELIRVRNESSKKELDARIIAPGIVEVAM